MLVFTKLSRPALKTLTINRCISSNTPKFNLFKSQQSSNPKQQILTVTPRKSFKTKFLLSSCALLGIYTVYKIKRTRKLSTNISRLLRDGIWSPVIGARSGKPDFLRTISCYLDALKEADKLGIPHWHDDYTGIQVALAKTYEELNRNYEASLVYGEIAISCFIALNSDRIPRSKRNLVIGRGLKAAYMVANLSARSVEGFKFAVLMTADISSLAVKEAQRGNPEISEMLQSKELDIDTLSNDLKSGRLPDDVFKYQWGGYEKDLITLQELMTSIFASVGAYNSAMSKKMETIKIMITSGFPIGECLFSTVNLGLLWYMREVDKNKKSPVNALHPVKNNNTIENARSDVDNNVRNDASVKGNSEIHKDAVPLPTHTQTTPPNLSPASDIFSEIIAVVNTIQQKRQPFVTESLVLALYGQGIIEGTLGNWKSAEEKLNEAKLRARGKEMTLLVHTIDSELDKISKVKDLSPQEISKIDVSEIVSPTEIMLWKLQDDPQNEIVIEI